MNLLLDNIIFSIQRMGGISVVWQELLSRALRDPELQCKVLDYASENVCRKELDIPDALNMPLRKWERYRTPDFRAEEPTIFHSSYFRVLPQKGVKNITTVHDLTYHFYRQGPAKWVHSAEEIRALRQSEGVICVSENTKTDLLRIYPWLHEDRIQVVYNGVGEHFRPLEDAENKGYLLFVGNRAVSYKRIDLAVRIAELTGLELVMIGGKLSAEEEKMLRERLGEGRYRAASNLPNEALCRYYNEALCLLYPSDYEGFGIPIVEAQRSGCPVIAQSLSSIPEVAGSAALLFPHSETEKLAREMAEAVNGLKNGSISRSTLQEAGFMNAQRFSWDNTYQETKKFYNAIFNL